MREVYVNTAADLDELCRHLSEVDLIALDTEFMRDKTYYSQLCLVQIATHEMIACIDTLALNSIDALLDQLYRQDLLKILHSGRQDMEVFFDIRGYPMKNVFDTQIAASFLGLGEQLGYAALVQNEIGVELAKEHTRTDWSKRPLDTGQLRYAADDVRYLHSLHASLTGQLESLNRLDWVEEECRALCDAALYQKDNDTLWQRVKNWQVLQGASLGYLKLLAVWRETRAQQADCPRRWVLDDQTMIQFAAAKPSEEKIAQGLFSEKFWQRNNRDMLQLMHQARQLADSEIPQPPPRHSLNAAQSALFKQLQKAIKEKASALNIAASTLARRADLESWVRGEEPVSLSQGWRRQVLAEILLVAANE